LPILPARSVTFAILIAAATLAPRADAVSINGTIRDFCYVTLPDTCLAHPDFEVQPLADERGIVEPVLGADGRPVYALGDGAASTTTSGQANFDQWYRDTVGVNASQSFSIELDSSGTFSDFSFFPIDGQLFGNQGLDHNYHFTLELHGLVNFSGDETLTFEGDDDVWVFINGHLALDLGGIHPTESETVDLSLPEVQSALDVVPGQDYSIDIFYAERHTVASTFTLQTTLQFVPEPGTAVLLGSALIGIAANRRSRARRR
jgi:fibro-slime domain-containing protein